MSQLPRWTELSPEQQRQYLLDNRVKLEDMYIDETQVRQPQGNFSDCFAECQKKVHCREVSYYKETDTWLYQALDLYPINGLQVAVMGSVHPWYESIVLEFEGHPTTIDYNLPHYNVAIHTPFGREYASKGVESCSSGTSPEVT